MQVLRLQKLHATNFIEPESGDDLWERGSLSRSVLRVPELLRFADRAPEFICRSHDLDDPSSERASVNYVVRCLPK